MWFNRKKIVTNDPISATALEIARQKLQEREERKEQINICLKAGICPYCSCNLIPVNGFNSDSPWDELKCNPCAKKFLYFY